MARRNRILFLFACCAALLPAISLYAQTTPGTRDGERAPSSVSLGFDKNINTYNWTFSGMFNIQEHGWNISAQERYLTTVIASDEDRVKDDQSFTLDVVRSVLPRLSVTGSMNSFIFSDTRTLGLNKLSTNTFLGGLQWEPYDGIMVSPAAGYTFDNQQSILDDGMVYSGAASVQAFRLGTSMLDGKASYSLENIQPREQNEYMAQASLLSLFTQDSRNQFSIQYRNFSRDFYLLTDTVSVTANGIEFAIESREESSFSLSDAIQYRIADPLRLGLSLGLTQRTILRSQKKRIIDADNPVFDTDVDEFRANAAFEAEYSVPGTSLWKARIEHSGRDETHTASALSWASPEAFARQEKLEELKNNSIAQTQLGFQFTQRVSANDTITVLGSSVKMQYDTPSNSNNDDRDELFLVSGFRWTRRFSPILYTTFQADATLRHTVYLFSERSANNNWNRIFRISPAAHVRIGDRFHSITSGEVLANYTVYDFESTFTDVRSFSFRQLTVSDSATIGLGSCTSVSARLQFRFYERGELYWDAFTVRPTTFFDERTYVLFFTYEKLEQHISTGFRMFEQTRYDYDELEKKEAGTLLSYGPTARVQLRSGDLGVLIDCWYQITRESDNETRTSPSVLMQVSWLL